MKKIKYSFIMSLKTQTCWENFLKFLEGFLSQNKHTSRLQFKIIRNDFRYELQTEQPKPSEPGGGSKHKFHLLCSIHLLFFVVMRTIK